MEKNDEPPPEGPECRRVAEGLLGFCLNKQISQFRILGGRFAKKAPLNIEKVSNKPSVIGGGVKGKFIWLQFSDDMCLWVTLGMSGYWSTVEDKHAHFAIDFENGQSIYFIDQRRFGTLRFEPISELPKKLASLGIDLLNSDGDFKEWVKLVKKHSKKTIVEVLMNQGVCAGVGNYIKCEVLYRVKLDPEIEVENITSNKLQEIYNTIKLIIRASYLQGGASIRNYKQVDGSHGSFVFEFQVYNKQFDPLGNPVVRRDTPDGRTTHWVPQVQSRYKYLNWLNGE